MAADPTSLRIVDEPAKARYEAWLDGKLAGFAEYRLRPNRIVFTHTEVDPAFEGKGVGSRLAAGVLDDARRRGLSVLPICPFVAAYIKRHPEYADLVAGGA